MKMEYFYGVLFLINVIIQILDLGIENATMTKALTYFEIVYIAILLLGYFIYGISVIRAISIGDTNKINGESKLTWFRFLIVCYLTIGIAYIVSFLLSEVLKSFIIVLRVGDFLEALFTLAALLIMFNSKNRSPNTSNQGSYDSATHTKRRTESQTPRPVEIRMEERMDGLSGPASV